MKHLYNLILLSALSLLSEIHSFAFPKFDTEVMTEYKTNPLGIDNLRPRFSWITESPEEMRDCRQTSYRIIVASSEKKLNSNNGDIWDSGTIKSAETIGIQYGGNPLESKRLYYWKVKIHINGKDAGWSEKGVFSMGMLNENDWNGAQWISYLPDSLWKEERQNFYKEVEAKYKTVAEQQHWIQNTSLWDLYNFPSKPVTPSPQLRKEFSIGNKHIETAFLYVSGLGYYEAYVNGEKVGDQLLSSGVMDYSSRVPYETFDIKDLLNSGTDNAIGIWLGNGHYNQNVPDAWKLWYRSKYNYQPRTLVFVEIRYSDGTRTEIVSDGTWKAKASPIIFDNVYNGEIYDANKENIGWSTIECDESGWIPASIAEKPEGRLEAFKMQPVRVLGQDIVAVEIKEIEPGKWRYDFGKEFTGRVVFRGKQPKGTRIVTTWSEGLWNSGETFNHMMGAGRYQQWNYICKGEGIEEYAPVFSYCNGRYVLLEGYEGIPDKSTLTGQVIASDLPRTIEFSCSNDMINKINTAVMNTHDYLIHSYPEDCSHREKSGWGDWNTLAGGTSVFSNFTPLLYEKWMDDFVSSFRPENNNYGGMITPTFGASGGIGDLCWSGAYIVMPYLTYKQFGDKKIIEDNYQYMKQYMIAVYDKETGQSGIPGILDGGMGDWVSPDDVNEFSGPDIKNTTVYYWYCNMMMELANLMNDYDGLEIFKDRAAKVKDALNEYLYDESNKDYFSRSRPSTKTRQFNYLMPLRFGMVEPQNEMTIMNRLLYNIMITENNHLNTGHIGSKHLMDLLPSIGYGDVAVDIVTNPTYPGWGDWIMKGATTIPENWGYSISHTHSCFLSVGSYFYQYIAGIRQNEKSVAFKNIMIKPTGIGHKVNSASGTYHSMRGTIISEWESTDSAFMQRAVIPCNTTAEIHVFKNDLLSPVLKEGENIIFENGEYTPGVSGIKNVYDSGDYLVVEAGSGHYAFKLTSSIGLSKDHDMVFDIINDDGVILDCTEQQEIMTDIDCQSSDGMFTFNGTDDKIILNNSYDKDKLHPGVRFTIEALIKADDISENRIIYYSGNSDIHETIIRLNDGKIEFSVNTVSGFKTIYADASKLNDGNFHHILCCYDGIEKSIFLDGKKCRFSTDGPGAISSVYNGISCIGSMNGKNCFAGSMKYIRLYSKSFSAKEVAEKFSQLE